MTTIIGLAALALVALVGWAIAEGKQKALGYHNTDEETAALQRSREAQKQAGYAELNIKDVIKTISTRGFSAV